MFKARIGVKYLCPAIKATLSRAQCWNTNQTGQPRGAVSILILVLWARKKANPTGDQIWSSDKKKWETFPFYTLKTLLHLVSCHKKNQGCHEKTKPQKLAKKT